MRCFCGAPHHTGCRISETLVLTPKASDLSSKSIVFKSLKKRRPWSVDADGHLFRLVSGARRIRPAHLFDPALAGRISLGAAPHHITAVYGPMLPRSRCGLCSPTILAQKRRKQARHDVDKLRWGQASP